MRCPLRSGPGTTISSKSCCLTRPNADSTSPPHSRIPSALTWRRFFPGLDEPARQMAACPCRPDRAGSFGPGWRVADRSTRRIFRRIGGDELAGVSTTSGSGYVGLAGSNGHITFGLDWSLHPLAMKRACSAMLRRSASPQIPAANACCSRQRQAGMAEPPPSPPPTSTVVVRRRSRRPHGAPPLTLGWREGSERCRSVVPSEDHSMAAR